MIDTARTSLLVVVSVLLFQRIAVGDPATQTLPELSETRRKSLLEGIRAREQAFHNVHSVAQYEDATFPKDKSKGTNVQWKVELQTVYWDDLTRLRIESQKGTLDAKGQPLLEPNERYTLYDGEKTVEFRHALADDYRGAAIFPGLWPPGKGPSIVRQPLTFIEGTITSQLNELLRRSGTVAARALKADGQYLLSFQSPYLTTLVYEVDVDATRGHILPHWRAINNGKLMMTMEGTFRRDDASLWIPTGAVLSTFYTEGGLATQTILKIKTCNANDPHFPNDVFELVLEPGTAVSDKRFGVDYTVGSESAVGSKITELAERARDEARETADPLPRPSARQSSNRFYLLAANAVLVAIVVVALSVRWYRRSR